MSTERRSMSFELDGAPVTVELDAPPGRESLLDVLRDRFGVRSPKDGCAPQGQCGCCTVWVDGQARVACVTPVERVAGRSVTTVEGLDPSVAAGWSEALCATGGSQCGFCTPGIVMRLAALGEPGRSQPAAVRQALLAHLCRCTGWQTIVEAATSIATAPTPAASDPSATTSVPSGAMVRDPGVAAHRARLEGGVRQAVDPAVALGRGGFAADTAPAGTLVAMRSAEGEWVVGETLAEARRRSGVTPGRRTTAPLRWPIEVAPGDWVRTLRTTWVEPAYLEPDASWCTPGGEPASPLANGGAFGGKGASEVGAVARRLADQYGRPVLATYARTDVVRFGPKRPPLAIGLAADGTGVVRVARTVDIAQVIRDVAPGLAVEEVDVDGPPTSCALRGAGWVEVAVARSSLSPGPDTITAPSGASAAATIDDEGVRVEVRCGSVLDAAVLRSYCIGAAHMALGWVRSEAIAVDERGEPLDLTIRSFGVLRATDVPHVEVTIVDDDAAPVNGSDAVFAAVAAAAWRQAGHPDRWPTDRR